MMQVNLSAVRSQPELREERTILPGAPVCVATLPGRSSTTSGKCNSELLVRAVNMAAMYQLWVNRSVICASAMNSRTGLIARWLAANYDINNVLKNLNTRMMDALATDNKFDAFKEFAARLSSEDYETETYLTFFSGAPATIALLQQDSVCRDLRSLNRDYIRWREASQVVERGIKRRRGSATARSGGAVSEGKTKKGARFKATRSHGAAAAGTFAAIPKAAVTHNLQRSGTIHTGVKKEPTSASATTDFSALPPLSRSKRVGSADPHRCLLTVPSFG